MAFEAYSVAVKLSLINNVTSGLLLISKNLQSANMDAKALQKSMGGIAKQMAIGGAMFAGGLGIAALFKKPLEEAEKYQTALTRFKQMNLGEAVNKDADNMARHANAFGTSATEMMNTLRDLHAAFGSYDEAKHFAPKIAELNAANSAIYGSGHGIDEGETKALAKVIEMRGGTVSPAAFNRELDLMQRMKNSTGGVIDAKGLRAFMSTAGIAGRSLSDGGMQNLSGLIVEMGGNRAGTALMSMYQNLIAGRTTKKAMAEIAGLGLGTLSEVSKGKVGHKKQTTTTLKSIKGADELKADPVGWIKDILLPQLKSKGITDQSTILKTINDIMSNRTGANLASISATQLGVIRKDAANARNAHGVDATIADAKQTLQGRMTDLSAKWSGVMLELGVTVLPLAISAASKLIPVLQSTSTWIQKNSGAVKIFSGALLGLSAFLVGGGLINMFWAAGRGFGLLYTVFGKWPGLLQLVIGTAARSASAISSLFSLVGVGMRGLGIIFLNFGRALMVNPIGLAIAAASIALYLGYKNWSTIWPKLKKIWNEMPQTLMDAWNRVKSFFGMGDKSPEVHYNAKGGTFVQVHTTTNLDGKKMAETVSKHQGQATNAANSGGRHDGGIAMPMPASMR